GGSTIAPIAIANVAPQVWDNLNLLFQAPVTLTTPQSQLTGLRQTYGFRLPNGYAQGYLGLNYKWFQDRTNRWWALTPRGALHQWVRRAPFPRPIATPGPVVYDDPNTYLFRATLSNELAELRHDYGFQFAGRVSGDYYQGWLNLNYMWFQDRNTNWYA